MTSAAPSLRSQIFDARSAQTRGLSADLLRRRAAQRRGTLQVQAVSCTINAITLLLYVHSGAITIVVPIAYVACGLLISGIFLMLSEVHFSDRFEDHYLTMPQLACNIAMQVGFLIAAPQIGYAFLSALFVIFSFGSLRMTARQATISWSLTVIGVAPVFLLTQIPVGMPEASYVDRLAGMFCFVVTIGQCVFVGLYGSSLRRQLYKSSQDLKVAYLRIEELAELDELTGAYNRRCIMRMLEDEIARAKRLKTPCSVALIDLDFFKRINDAQGHPTGDEVLRTFAIGVFANIRTIDKFGRYGGEEFLLLLPDTPHDAAARMLDRLRIIISDVDWTAFSLDMAVTISAGVATLNVDETPDALLARADKALYAAKRDGRNRIASA